MNLFDWIRDLFRGEPSQPLSVAQASHKAFQLWGEGATCLYDEGLPMTRRWRVGVRHFGQFHERGSGGTAEEAFARAKEAGY
jgi:hypothetical protein